MADISKEINDFLIARKGEDVRESLISLAEKVNKEATDASQSSADSASSAQQAIETAMNAAENANGEAHIASAAAEAARNAAETVQNKLNNGEFIGPQGPVGEPFYISKVYSSVNAMNTGYTSDGVKPGCYVMINTGNVENEDNAKVYVKGSTSYEFVVDLSGAQGQTGPQGVKGDKGDKGEKGDTPSSITGNAGSATRLQNSRKIDGVAFDGSGDIHHYGECTTAAGTGSKTVSLSGFALVKGAEAVIKFTNGNTAANPTLNINNTGAKSIYYKGAAVPAEYILENSLVQIIYDGDTFRVVGTLQEKDSGWNNLVLTAGLTVPDWSHRPSYRKKGNHVYIRGAVVGVKDKNMKIANLPVGFRPLHHERIVNKAMGTKYCAAFINSLGDLYIENCWNNGQDGQYNTGDWYNITIDYFLD